MDKEQKEIELKKLEVEKLKIELEIAKAKQNKLNF